MFFMPFILVFAFAVGHLTAQEQTPSAPAPLTVQITSPLGRTGMIGAVRIVARVVATKETVLSPVQFFVDGKMIGEDKDGPPYALEWTDENPFEKREILVQVADAAGHSAKDTIELKPLEIIETTNISSVVLDPAVFDANGRPVNGLVDKDFTVTEDGVEQKLDVAKPDMVPAIYTLLVDSSQSMSRRIDFVQEAARELPSRLRTNDEVVVVPFSKRLGAITGPTKDRDTIAGAIGAIKAQGGTSILDCLAAAAKQVSRIDGRQIIVLVTDGYDENSFLKFDQALDVIKATNATVYVIAVAGVAGVSLKGEDMLRRLATETGGRAFFPAREEQLADVHLLIAADVQQRYVVTYTPSNQKLDGTWRAIQLSTGDPKHVIKVRAGYYAPAPPPIRPQIEMTVKDLNRELLDVTPDDFIVTEDGVEQKIDGFEESLTPVNIMLLLDASGSMKKDSDAAVEAARSFIKTLPGKDKLAVMTFADKVVLQHELTTLREWSLEAIGKYQANGGTALYDALNEALVKLKRTEGRAAIVVVTDGRDENNPGTAAGSVATFPEVLAKVKDVGATIYSIGLGAKVDRETLEKVATASGGESYFPLEVSSLEGDYKRIIEDLRRRYVISYTSTNFVRDGGWRRVEIKSKRDGIVIDSKGGYFAPEDK